MGFLTTWAIDGSRTPAAVARAATFAASKEPGVVEPWHLRVVPTAAGTVALTPGAVLIPAGTSGTARWQMYVAVVDSGDGDATATVVMPSSSSWTLHVHVVVPDPERAGVAAPADPLTAVYAEARLLTDAQQSQLTLPSYRVATIVIPADAAAITAGMITDRRRVARPRKERLLRAHRVSSGEVDRLDVGATDGEAWPNVGPYLVQCPPWATKALVVATFAQVVVPGGAFQGTVWVGIGPGASAVQTPTTIIQDSGGAGVSRQTFVATGTVTIPESLRGTEVGIATYGRVLSGSSATYPVLQSGSGVVVDVEFQEEAI